MKKSIIFSIFFLLLISACSSSRSFSSKSSLTQRSYLEDGQNIELDLRDNLGPYIDVSYPETTNAEFLEKSKYIVYAEIKDVYYYNVGRMHSIAELNVLDSLGAETAPQTLFLASDQCILPARQAIADPVEAARALAAYEKDPDNTYIPDEDEYYTQILPGERYYCIGDRYVFLLQEGQSESLTGHQSCVIPVLGKFGVFLEVGDNQFVSVEKVQSDIQTLSLDTREVLKPAVSNEITPLTLEDFEQFASSGEFPVEIMRDNLVVRPISD